MKLYRTIVLPDIHTPRHHEPSLKAILPFIKDFKPDRLVQLGDFCDWDCMSKHSMYNVDEFIEMSDEVKAANLMLDRLEKVLPPKCEKIMLGGNHEDRYHQAKAAHMFVPDKISKSMAQWKDSWAHEYDLDKRGWKWTEYGEIVEFGKLVFTHGWFAAKTSGDMRSTADQAPGKNIICGHNHKHHVYGCMDEKGLPIESESIGTLSRFDLSYLRGRRATDWVHGFMFIYTKKDGKFNKYFTHVIDGEFIANGKVY